MEQHYLSIEHYFMASVKHLESTDFDMMQRFVAVKAAKWDNKVKKTMYHHNKNAFTTTAAS